MAAQPNKPSKPEVAPKESEVDQPKVQPSSLPEPEKVLFTWKAPARPFKRRDKEFWMSVFAIAAVFGLILFLVEGAMPVILLISVIFLYYILSTVEPDVVEYNITTLGVKIATKRTDWDFLTRFWFSRRLDSELLVFEMLSLPGRLELVIDSKDKEKIRKTLSTYVVEEEVPPANLDKLANWFSKKLPGNK